MPDLIGIVVNVFMATDLSDQLQVPVANHSLAMQLIGVPNMNERLFGDCDVGLGCRLAAEQEACE
jgi:hypothetical protein